MHLLTPGQLPVGIQRFLLTTVLFQSLQLEIAESCLTCISVSFPTANRFKLVPQPVLSHPHSFWPSCHQLLLGLLPGSPPCPLCLQRPPPDQPVHLPRVPPRAHLPHPPTSLLPPAPAPCPVLHRLCSNLRVPSPFPGCCARSCSPTFAGMVSLAWNPFPHSEVLPKP